jgi:hypothetical protein
MWLFSNVIIIVLPLVFLISAIESRDTCLKYDNIVDKSISSLQYEKYEGIWYNLATNEPTQPAFCRCDSFNWTTTSASTFQDPTTFSCAKHQSSLGIKGDLSDDASRIGLLQVPYTPLTLHLSSAPFTLFFCTPSPSPSPTLYTSNT